MSNQPAQPAATPSPEAGFPLDFSLCNRQEQASLYILGGAQDLLLRITNTSRHDLALTSAGAGAGAAAADDGHHFALAFRPGTLKDPQKVELGPGPFALARGRDADGCDVFYLRAQKALSLTSSLAGAATGRLELTLRNLEVEPGGGTRPTLARLSCRNLGLAGAASPLSTTRIHHLTVLNQFPPDPGGHPLDLEVLAEKLAEARAPLDVRLLGSNTVLNDGESLNRRVLRLTNTTRQALPLTDTTRLVLTFDVHSTETAPWGLVTQNDLGSLGIENVAQEGTKGWEVRPDGTRTTWTLEEPEADAIPPGASLDVPITFKCSAPSGDGHLRVRYENISGIPDGEVPVQLHKGPLVFRDNGPEGIVATRSLGAWRGSEVNFYRETWNESTSSRPAPQGTVGLVKNDDMSLVSDSAGNWLRIGAKNARIAFWTDGGAAGDGAPQMFLEGARLSLGNSSVESEKLSVGGVEIAAVDRNDPGVVGGYLVPKGGILLWSGAADRLPQGWALCNGQNNTPDLRDRFVLGAAGRYQVGANGGAEEVALSIDQIPSHDHGFSDPGHSHGISRFRNSSTDRDDSSLDVYARDNNDSIRTWTEKTGINFTAQGGNRSHSNMPPYYSLCYIMKL